MTVDRLPSLTAQQQRIIAAAKTEQPATEDLQNALAIIWSQEDRPAWSGDVDRLIRSALTKMSRVVHP